MKIKMDLLPMKYKCVRRNYLAMFALILIILIGIGACITTALSMQTYKRIVEKSMKKGLEASRRTLENAQAKQDMLKRNLQKIAFDIDKQLKLNEEISAFNEITRGFRWSRFLHQLELMIPKRVWIKDIDISKAPHFTLVCESADQILPITFEQNLILNTDYFDNVLLGETILVKQNLAVLFRISFDYSDKEG